MRRSAPWGLGELRGCGSLSLSLRGVTALPVCSDWPAGTLCYDWSTASSGKCPRFTWRLLLGGVSDYLPDTLRVRIMVMSLNKALYACYFRSVLLAAANNWLFFLTPVYA